MKIKNLFLLCILQIIFVVGTSAASKPETKWIWIDNNISQDTWACFRKSFDLDKMPQGEITANIAVDSKYWLWINGHEVVVEGGLAGSPSQAGEWNRKEKITPSNTWFEKINIKPYLKEGKNVISTLVWYWGRETHKGTYIKKRGGLYFDCNLGTKSISSDKSWKSQLHLAYDTVGCVVSKMIVPFKVKYNAQNSMNDWYKPSFNDKSWNNAVELGKKGDAPWYNLEERYVPALVNHGLLEYQNNADMKFPFISKGKTIEAKLPFNRQITPCLEVESNGGDTIFITTDDPKNGVTAQYITKKGKQSFESFSWMNGNIVKYTIPANVNVLSLKYRWMTVGEMAGKFSVDDPFYQRIWDMCYNTLFVCARDNFMDCPDRERALWIGDISDQSSYLYYSMDNSGRELLKMAIQSTLNFSENKVFGALGPLRVRELVCQSLQFVAQCIWPYYMNTGDKETLAFAYPHVYDYLALFQMDDKGLPVYRRGKSPDTWDWLDWGVKGTIDNAPIQISTYYMALDRACKMAQTLGKTSDVKWYEERMSSIKKNFDKYYWKNGFYSSDAEKFKDDRANAMTIVSGLADASHYNDIIDNVLTKNYFSSPHFEWMVEEAMCIAGRHGDALDRMKKQYQPQVDDKHLTTLYEFLPKGGSYNHAWNAPNAIFATYIAGIYPVEKGWSKFEIMPNMVNFKNLEQLIPTVKGDVKIKLNSQADKFSISLNSPKNSSAVVGIPLNGKKYTQITVNGKSVWSNNKFKSDNKSISFAGQDSKYIKLNIVGGNWDIIAK